MMQNLKCWVKISYRCAALENFGNDVDITRAWARIRENIKASATKSQGYYELK
jgi:hypothetical protein